MSILKVVFQSKMESNETERCELNNNKDEDTRPVDQCAVISNIYFPSHKKDHCVLNILAAKDQLKIQRGCLKKRDRMHNLALLCKRYIDFFCCCFPVDLITHSPGIKQITSPSSLSKCSRGITILEIKQKLLFFFFNKISLYVSDFRQATLEFALVSGKKNHFVGHVPVSCRYDGFLSPSFLL